MTPDGAPREGAIAPPGIGHNNPPPDELISKAEALVSDMPDEERDASVAAVGKFIALRSGNADLKERVELIEAKFKGIPEKIEDDEVLARTVTFVKAITGADTVLKGRKAEFKQPVNALLGFVDGYFSALSDRLATVKKVVVARQTTYATAKADAEKAAREAEAKALREMADEALFSGDEAEEAKGVTLVQEAARVDRHNTPAENTRTRGVGGGTGSLKTTWHWEVTNLADVPREWLCVDEKKVNAAVCNAKGLRDIPGLRIFDKKGFVSGGR